MKDGINKQKPNLKTTIECIGLMYQSLQSLHERIYPQNPVWFAIMAISSTNQTGRGAFAQCPAASAPLTTTPFAFHP
jgi:hypothetical protein